MSENHLASLPMQQDWINNYKLNILIIHSFVFRLYCFYYQLNVIRERIHDPLIAQEALVSFQISVIIIRICCSSKEYIKAFI